MIINKKTIILVIISVLALAVLAIIVLFQKNASYSEASYEREQKRFEEVLQQASDEELFTVLKYAIAHRFVPNRDVDPFFDMYVMVGCWQRSLKVYNKLLDREDLLRQIYPDVEVLDDYVKWGRQTGEPYPDTLVSQTILYNVLKDSKQLDSLMGSPSYKESLEYKYYGTPLMRERIVVSHRKSVQ